MQPVLVTQDEAEFNAAWTRLVEAGIAVTERPTYAAMVKYTPGVHGRAIHVLMHHQFEDAKAVLTDPNHKVAHPISGQEVLRMQREASDAVARTSTYIGTRFIGVAVGVALALLVILPFYVGTVR